MKIIANVIIRTTITDHPVFYNGCNDEDEIHEALLPELYGLNDRPIVPEDGKVVTVMLFDDDEINKLKP